MALICMTPAAQLLIASKLSCSLSLVDLAGSHALTTWLLAMRVTDAGSMRHKLVSTSLSLIIVSSMLAYDQASHFLYGRSHGPTN